MRVQYPILLLVQLTVLPEESVPTIVSIRVPGLALHTPHLHHPPHVCSEGDGPGTVTIPVSFPARVGTGSVVPGRDSNVPSVPLPVPVLGTRCYRRHVLALPLCVLQGVVSVGTREEGLRYSTLLC